MKDPVVTRDYGLSVRERVRPGSTGLGLLGPVLKMVARRFKCVIGRSDKD